MEKNGFRVDFIGIGAPRSGTTWIQQCLIEHPQVCGAKIKDLKFFCHPENYNQGLDFYASYFSHCRGQTIKGEFTMSYLMNEKAAHLIKKHFPEVKLIACLRNPVERAHSHYLYYKRKEITGAKTFEEALAEDLKNDYIRGGFYFFQLKNYLELFPKNNVLILIYEDIVKNPLRFIQGIYKFLGIDSNFIPPSANKEINWVADNFQKIPLLNLTLAKIKNFLHRHYKLLRPVVLFLKKTGVKKLVNSVMLANKRSEGLERYAKPPISEKTRRYLREIYRPEIKNLEKLINRDLSFWQ